MCATRRGGGRRALLPRCALWVCPGTLPGDDRSHQEASRKEQNFPPPPPPAQCPHPPTLERVFVPLSSPRRPPAPLYIAQKRRR